MDNRVPARKWSVAGIPTGYRKTIYGRAVVFPIMPQGIPAEDNQRLYGRGSVRNISPPCLFLFVALAGIATLPIRVTGEWCWSGILINKGRYYHIRDELTGRLRFSDFIGGKIYVGGHDKNTIVKIISRREGVMYEIPTRDVFY